MNEWALLCSSKDLFMQVGNRPTGCGLPTHALHVYPLPAASLRQQRALENIKRPRSEEGLDAYRFILHSCHHWTTIFLLLLCLLFSVLFGFGVLFSFCLFPWQWQLAPVLVVSLPPRSQPHCVLLEIAGHTQASACSPQVWAPALWAPSFLAVTPLLVSVTSSSSDGSSFL